MGREILARLVARARQAWPELGSVSNAELEAFIVARVPDAGLDENVLAEDLLLACACANGIRAAHDALQELCESDVARAYARIRPPASEAQVRHLVWTRLFHIPDGGAARIALYKGETDLVTYVRSTTSRLMLSLASGEKVGVASLEDAILQAPGAAFALDPELQRVRQTYLPGLELTVAHTLTSLEARERALLRDAIVEQHAPDALALLYGASREAIARSIVAAREKLEYRIKQRLVERMRISDRDHASLARLVTTQLDAALSRIDG
jgi:RNA polymerase sigma-70 factor